MHNFVQVLFSTENIAKLAEYPLVTYPIPECDYFKIVLAKLYFLWAKIFASFS